MDAAKKLISNLENMKNDYKKLRKIIGHKQEAILQRELDKIRETTEREEIVLGQLRELGDLQRELWSVVADCESEEVQLKELQELLACLDADARDEYRKKRVSLKMVIRDVQRINAENMELLQYRLEDIEDLFNTVFDELEVEKETNTYDKKLDKKKQDKTSMLIDRSI